jgi:hypothetical protein
MKSNEGGSHDGARDQREYGDHRGRWRPVGTVDRVVNDRIKLKKRDGGDTMHKGHHHYIEMGFVAGVEGQKVRLSANAAIAVTLEEEQSGRPVDLK